MKNILKVASAFVILLSVVACSDDDTSNATSETARVQFKLVDAPGDYLEVNVVINDIQYNNSEDEGGWVSLGDPDDFPIEVDLTQLIAGNDLLLADELIPVGYLNQIRLILGDGNTLVIEGEPGEENTTVELRTPSAQQSGLKLKIQTDLEPDFTYSFILDWDVNKSIVMAGSSGNYNLKPTIKVIAVASSGSISGTVVDDGLGLGEVTIEVYDSLDEYVTSTITNDSGQFLVLGLAEGMYKIRINATGYAGVETEFIDVVAGEVTLAGEITLIAI